MPDQRWAEVTDDGGKLGADRHGFAASGADLSSLDESVAARGALDGRRNRPCETRSRRTLSHQLVTEYAFDCLDDDISCLYQLGPPERLAGRTHGRRLAVMTGPDGPRRPSVGAAIRHVP